MPRCSLGLLNVRHQRCSVPPDAPVASLTQGRMRVVDLLHHGSTTGWEGLAAARHGKKTAGSARIKAAQNQGRRRPPAINIKCGNLFITCQNCALSENAMRTW